MNLLLLGATGLVGGRILALALADPRVARVAAPTRRALPPHDKLENPTAADLERLVEEPALWPADAVACALGATLKKAGGREPFRRVDYDLPMAFARAARRRGTGTFALVSALGASPRAPFFYARTKGELERDLTALGFPSLFLARPNFIAGARPEPRPFERWALGLLRGLAPLLPRGMRASPAESIARAVLAAAVTPTAGVRIMGSEAFG